MANAALDSDVILKGASYGIIRVLLDALPDGPFTHGALGAARFMLPKKLAKKRVARMVDAQADLTSVFATLEVLEPKDDEKRLAAELQFAAQKANLELDAGEAQLTTMVITRDLKHLLTGDKRAIAALGATPFPEGLAREVLTHRLMCLEQAIWALCDAQGADSVRPTICAEPDVDTQLGICFSCLSPDVQEASWREGLRSAIEQVRRSCPELLYHL